MTAAASEDFVNRLVDVARGAVAAGPARTLALRPAGVPVRVHLAGEELIDRLAPGMLEGVLAADERPAIELWAFDGVGSGRAAPPPPWGPQDYLQREEIAGWTRPPRLASYSNDYATLSVADTEAGLGVHWLRDATVMAPWEGGAPLREHPALDAGAPRRPSDPRRRGRRWRRRRPAAGLWWGGQVHDRAGLPAGGDGLGLRRLHLDPARLAADRVPGVRDRQGRRGIAGAVGRRRGSRCARDRCPAWTGAASCRLPIADVVCQALALRAVVLPQVAERTGTRGPVHAREALRTIAVSTLLQLPGDSATTLSVLRELLATLPVYTLEVGPDVAAIPEAIGALIATLTAEAAA